MNLLLEAFNNARRGDEFYTRYGDIEKELSNYNFSGMIVYCNCDNPESSNFVAFFKKNFESLGIRCLLATFNGSQPVLYRYDGVQETTKPIASGRFQDNINILKACDIVVTNPPFSNHMVVELIKMIMGARKRFIVVGPKELSIKKEIIPLLLSGQLNCGYNSIRNFDTSAGDDGKITTYWWTNLPVDKPDFPLTAHLDERIHRKYDNYDAINCDFAEFIPVDYDGAVGVPISFMPRFSSNQFTIHDVLLNPIVDGKGKMSRIIISKKG